MKSTSLELKPSERTISTGRYNRRGDDESRRVNEQIRYDEIRVIGPEGEQIGIMSARDAQREAEKRGLDLVEVASNANPVVCKIMDYGKFKYQQSKKKTSKSDNVSLKTLRIRPKTGEHDLKVKLNRAESFLDKGNQVKFVVQMRGRERKYVDRWTEMLSEIIEDLNEQMERDIKIVSEPQSQGWQITAIVEPS